jgi:hypothetical protein
MSSNFNYKLETHKKNSNPKFNQRVLELIFFLVSKRLYFLETKFLGLYLQLGD